MKKVLLFFLLLIALVMNRGMIFAVEGTDSDIDEKKSLQIQKDVGEMLNKRANLWNKLFSEEAKLEEIKEELKEIVADPLLTYDIEAFRKIKKNHTSMERILKVKVVTVQNIKVNDSEISIDIEVEWLMEGLEKNYKEKVLYDMKLIKGEDGLRISDYNVK